MDWQTAVSIIAIIVTVAIAIFAYLGNRRLQRKQRLSELALAKLQSLEAAKVNISQISSEMNVTLNLLHLNVGGEDTDVHQDRIFKLFGDAVDVFNGVKHNLNRAKAEASYAGIVEVQRAIADALESDAEPTEEQMTALKDQMKSLTDTPGNLRAIIEKEIEDLQRDITKS